MNSIGALIIVLMVYGMLSLLPSQRKQSRRNRG